MWWWNDGWPMPWVVGPLFMLVFIIFCGTMMFMMMRGRMGGPPARFTDESHALEILKERYARGEISLTEYEERRLF